jgi:hypothetical protein
MKVILASLALALAPHSAFSADVDVWSTWGVAPYASSPEESCRKAPEAIDGFSLPEAVKKHFKEVLGTTCISEKDVWLTPGQVLEQMWSGGERPHIMNGKTVANLPVLKSPEGRRYRKDSVSETARASSWTFAYEGKTYILYDPFVCFNRSWTYGPPQPQVAAPPPPGMPLAAPPPAHPTRAAEPKPLGACPSVYTLKVNVWDHAAFSLPGVERTHAKEELEGKFVGASHVSRTHGRQFREAYANGTLRRSTTPRDFRVSLITTPEATGGKPTLSKEQFWSDVSVTGVKELRFTWEELKDWDAIRVVSIKGDIISPPAFNEMGLHELRFFNQLPGVRQGEWSSNPVPDCIMNMHFLE